MNVSSSANSFAESSTSASPRQTRRVAGSRRRSPTSSTAGRSTGAAARQRAQPREQLGERERLGQVVVGAGVEAAIRSASPSRAVSISTGDQTPSARSRRQTSSPSTPGQHQVEDDRVVLGRARHPERVLARARDVRGVRFLFEAAPKECRKLHLVLDDQHTHAGIVTARR